MCTHTPSQSLSLPLLQIIIICMYYIITYKFLLNSKNKEKFIHHLQIYLRRNGVVCKQADGDADLLLVETALTGQKSVVVSEDTDVMVISLHYVSRYDTDLWILRPGKSGSANRYTNVCKLANDLGARVTSSILGFHALTGCDTTSAFYKIGKKSAYKTFEKHNFFENSLKYLYEEGNEEDVTKEGAKIIMALYGGKSTTLNDMRYELYRKKIARMTTSTSFDIASLPPTDSAGRMQILRAFLQIQQWLGKSPNPESWGWYKSEGDGLYLPKTGINQPIQTNFPKTIFCNCKTGCGSLCSCRRNGLRCTVMCGECIGEHCENTIASEANYSTDDSDGDFDYC